jgi:hypothetical protein
MVTREEERRVGKVCIVSVMKGQAKQPKDKTGARGAPMLLKLPTPA